ARQARLHRSNRHSERERNLIVTESVNLAQYDRRPLIERKPVECVLQPFGELLLREQAIRCELAPRYEFAVRRHVLIERHLIRPMAAPPEPVAVARLVDRNPVDPGAESGL